jgi:hypothetical protein
MKLSNIRIWQKLLLLGIIAAVLCAVPTYLYIRGANKEIRDTLTEIRGSLSEILCVRHNMLPRSMYAKQDTKEETSSGAAQHSERAH